MALTTESPVLEVEDVEQDGVIGAGQLKRKLSKLAKGQQVYWFNRALEPVPTSMEKDLLKYCGKLEIKLEIEPAQNNPWQTDSAFPLGFHVGYPWSQSR
ncbi:MAG TPA: hypothetical protein VKY92_01675 [Verrucomicrobiae bacterium]|nr:hypothetical protein [Verrucomicrobiae bacterium]